LSAAAKSSRDEWLGHAVDQPSRSFLPLFRKVAPKGAEAYVAANPYQSEVAVRPNPNPWRTAMFNFMEVQTLRHLTEQEVCEINFIIKSRSDWNTFGGGYLLMPDPRGFDFGGDIILGNRDGTATSFDAYGRRPRQRDFGREFKSKDEFETLHGSRASSRAYMARTAGAAHSTMRASRPSATTRTSTGTTSAWRSGTGGENDRIAATRKIPRTSQ
jgi:hypothetical protein